MICPHEVQLVNYLNGMKKEICLLINFGPSGVEVKQKDPEDPCLPRAWRG